MQLSLLACAATGALLLSSIGTHASDAPEPASITSAWKVDAAHSSVVFHTQHMGIAKFYGRFNAFEGEIQYDAASPTSSSVGITIDASSIDTNSEGRDKHLRSPDFFSAKEFPEIRFESASVEAAGDAFTVEGELTLHGVTKTIAATFEVVGVAETPRGTKAGFEAKLTIDMRDFGFSFVEKNPGAVGPEVHVVVSVECVGE